MKNNQKVALIFGTRPEIIKLSPLIRLFQKKKMPYFLIHSGQHYTYEMDKLFFKDLELPEPKYKLGGKSVNAAGQSDHVGQIAAGIEAVLLRERPRFALVQGDTNTVLAGALTASKMNTSADREAKGICIGHVEAGLRSYDRRMPEEINRFVTDHLSELLFAPTPLAKKILIKEGVPPKKIFMTGNTIVDAVLHNLKLAKKKSSILQRLRLKKKGFFVLTLHRQENVDHPHRLKKILEGLRAVADLYKQEVIFPIHPRTLKKIEDFNLKIPSGVRVMKPVGFLDFLALESSARLLLTDSGGVQEESMILGVPCVTLRDNTERPETVLCGANRLAGVEPNKILRSVKAMLAGGRTWKNVLGDGKAAERIFKILRDHN